MLDYHMHCQYSADSPASLRTQLEAAQAAGLKELCFTDHVDFDGSGLPPADIAARDRVAVVGGVEKLYGGPVTATDRCRGPGGQADGPAGRSRSA